jgi:hypothetical protein
VGRRAVISPTADGEFSWWLYDGHGNGRAIPPSGNSWQEPIDAAHDLTEMLQGILHPDGDWIALGGPGQQGIRVVYELRLPSLVVSDSGACT